MSDASFLGFIEGTLLVVDEVFEGEILIGLAIYGGGVVPGTVVVSYGTGSGGAGSYVVDKDQTAAGPQFYQNSLPVVEPPTDSVPVSGATPVVVETGPDYPRVNVVAGENAIGKFRIGVSQIGDIPLFDLWTAILSQYANSPTIIALIESEYAALEQTGNFDAFFDNMFNLDTAWGYGLDVWGRIVGIGRVIQIQASPYFGFAESGTAVGFEQGPFYSGAALTQNYSLNDQDYRRLIIAKAMANISDGSTPSINAILMELFQNRGNAWVSEVTLPAYFGFAESTTAGGFGQDPFYAGQAIPRMQIIYNFSFPLSPVDLGIVNSGVIPKPNGVAATINVI